MTETGFDSFVEVRGTNPGDTGQPTCFDHLAIGISQLQKILNEGNVVRSATLGPAGTSSDKAARMFVRSSSCAFHTVLHDTYEDAASAVIAQHADFLIVANAYAGINRFYISDQLIAAGVFPMKTPPYGIAVRPARGAFPAQIDLASHPAPLHLVERWFPDAPVKARSIAARSTGEAAKLVADGYADACITTETARQLHELAFITRTISIDMLWTVFVRRNHPLAHCLFGEKT